MLGRLQPSDNVSAIPYTAVQQFCVSAAIDKGGTVPLERRELRDARGSPDVRSTRRGCLRRKMGGREGVAEFVEDLWCPQVCGRDSLERCVTLALPRVVHSHCPHRLEAQDIALSRR